MTKKMNHLNISPEWIEFLFGHLRHESKLLDRAIESALEVKDMLKTQRSEATEFYRESSGNGAAMVSQIDRNESVRKHLGKMNRRIQRISTPILASRKNLSALVESLSENQKSSVSLTSIAMSLGGDQRTDLLALKREILEKHQQFTAISMSNQTVLVYTLNHYDQLLGSSNQSDFYNASGQTSEATAKSSYVKTSC